MGLVMDRLELRKMRSKHGLSPAQCARMVQVTERTWRRWEDGTRNMPPGAAELFKIKLEQLTHNQ